MGRRGWVFGVLESLSFPFQIFLLRLPNLLEYDKIVLMEDCLFCQIVAGKEPSERVLETDEFLVIKNKFQVAPVHALVLDKKHREKSETISGKHEGYWDKMMDAVYKTIKHLGLDKTGYKLVNNGAGYNHFEHEHLHVLGGLEEEPGGET